MKEPKNTPARITDQFRQARGTMYELKCDGVAVCISMSEVENKPEWEAEATAKVSPTPPMATGVGRTREEAFSTLRENWCSQRDGIAVPRLDWDAIRQALAAVRAI